MSRVISVDSTGSQRSRLRRTIAEALRRLMAKKTLDAEAKDLAALIVYCLREIGAGIDQSAQAWEKRDYYMKADRFRRDWEWVDRAARDLEQTIRADQWARLPVLLAGLMPRFADITITKMVRSADLWDGCYLRLMEEAARPDPATSAGSPSSKRLR